MANSAGRPVKPGAITYMSQGMVICATMVKPSSTESSTDMACSAKRFAAPWPPSVSSRLNSGTKAALKAPSAKRLRKRFGRRWATKKASAISPVPSTRAISTSRTKPSTRLAMVKPPTVAIDRISAMGGSVYRIAAELGSDGRRDGGRDRPQPIDLEDPHAAQRLVAQRLARDLGRQMGDGRSARQQDAVADAVIEGVAQLLQALGRVHRIADEGVVDPPRCADIADNGGTAMEADADAHGLQAFPRPALVVGRQSLADGERGAHRMEGVIRIVARRAPEGHDGIADIFVDRPLLGLHMLADQPEMAVEEARQPSRRMMRRDAREADDVGEHHRHLALLGLQPLAARLIEQAPHQRSRHIGLEPAQRPQHTVPGPARGIELAQGAAAGPVLAGEVEIRDGGGGLGQPLDGHGQAAPQ